MTSVDLDLIADFLGGALDGTPAESTVRARLAADPEWASAYESLLSATAAVQADLAECAAAVEAMPAQVQARLEAVLAGAVPAGSTPAGSTPAGVVTVVGDHRSARPTPGSLGQARRDPGSGTAADHSRPPGRGGLRRPRNPRRMGLTRTTTLAVAVIATALGLSVAIPALLTGRRDHSVTANSPVSGPGFQGASAPRPDGTGPVRIVTSGADYTRATVTGLLAQPAAAGPERAAAGSDGAGGVPHQVHPGADLSEKSGALDAPTTTRAAGDLGRLRGQDALAQCLAAVTAAHGGRVEMVDYARFEGRPALVVVAVATTRPASGRTVVVVGSGCGTTPSTTDELHVAAG